MASGLHGIHLAPFKKLCRHFHPIATDDFVRQLGKAANFIGEEQTTRLYDAFRHFALEIREFEVDQGLSDPNDEGLSGLSDIGRGRRPFTPPQSPERTGTANRNQRLVESLKKQVRDLETENLKQEAKIDELQQLLDEAYDGQTPTKTGSDPRSQQLQNRLQQLQGLLSKRHEELIKTRESLGYNQVAQGLFQPALEQFTELVQLMHVKVAQLDNQRNLADKLAAEKQKLKYEHERGQLLFDLNDVSKAEVEISRVLKRQREVYNDPNVRLEETRKIQLLLCRILRQQGSDDKSKMAEDIYQRTASSLASIDHLEEVERTWVLENTNNLANVRAERRAYEGATKKMKKVWAKRYLASPDYAETIAADTLKLLNTLERRGEDKHFKSLLDTLCQEEEPLTPELADIVARRGISLAKANKYKDAKQYLSKAWASSTLPGAQKVEVGWHLALTHCQFNCFEDANDVLLQVSHIRGSHGRLEIERNALLAHTQFRIGFPAQAIDIVADLCKEPPLRRIPTIPLQFNPADTLLRAAAKSGTKEHFIQGRKVWKNVYKYCEEHARDASPTRAIEIRQHVETAKKFGQDWMVAAEKRKNKPTAGQNVVKEAKKIEKLLYER